MKLPVINKFLLILKIHYFLFQAGIAPTQTALPVYAQTLGFSSFVVGTVYTVLPLTGMIIKPALGALADRFKWHKYVMLASEVVILACYFSVQFIPSAVQTSPQNVCFNSSISMCQTPSLNRSHFYLKGENKTNECTLECPITNADWLTLCKSTNCPLLAESNLTLQEICSPLEMSSVSLVKSELCWRDKNCQYSCEGRKNVKWGENAQDDSVTFSQYQIYVFILLLVGSWGGVTVATTLSDTICIAKSGDWSLYGRQRLWGSIGYGLLSIIIGLIVDAISSTDAKNYTPAFYSSFIVLIIDVVISYFYLHVEIPQTSKNFTKDVWKTFLNFRVLVFLVWCTAIGASMGLAWTFLYWMLENLAKDYGPDTVASIKTIEGLVNGVQTFVGEVPAFFFAYKVLMAIGHGHCMSLVFLIVGVRYVCYSLLVNPWYVLFIEPMQIYYGLFYSTLTSYATIIAPPGTEATVQSLMCAFVEGIGVAIGSFIGGIFIEKYDGSMTFRIFGIAYLILAVVNEIFEYFFKMVPRQASVVDQEGSETNSQHS